MTVRSQSFANQPDFWAACTTPAAIATPTGNKAVWTRTQAGEYVLTLGLGGAAKANCVVVCDINATVPFTYEVVHTSDTVKTLSVRNIAGNLIETTSIRASAYKLH